MKTANRSGAPVSKLAVAAILLVSMAGYVSALSGAFQAPRVWQALTGSFHSDDVAGMRAEEAPAALPLQSAARTAPAWLMNALPGYSSSQARAREAWYFGLDQSRDRLGLELSGGTFNSLSRGYNASSLADLSPSAGFVFLNTSASTARGGSTKDNGGIISGPDDILAARTWNNTGTDFNAAGSWTGGVPGSNDVGLFDVAAVTQPNVSASLTIAGLRFSTAGASGYLITNSGGAVLTLNGESTTGTSGTTTLSAAAIRGSNTSGTNTVDADLNLASSTGTSSFVQVSGGTLIVNGDVSGTGITLRLANSATSGGTIQLNGANTFSGGALIDSAGLTVVLGNDSALGTGTFTNNATSTLEAGGGARTLANNILLAGNMTISGGNAFTFNGTFTGSGSNTRTLTVNNSGGLTIDGNVYLAPDNTTGRGLIINGTSNVLISGDIANNNFGNAVVSNLTKSGAGTLTLSGTNTYTGTTTVNGGTLLINGDNSAATGAVAVNNTGTLGGTGTIGGAVTVNGGGTIAPGASVGTLTLLSNATFTGLDASTLATYAVDILGATSDLLTMAGMLDLSNLFDQITFSGTPDGTSSYLLAHADGGISGVFDFGSAPANYMFVYGTNDLSLVPIPEPSTWIGAALALAAIGFTQRRRFAKR